MANKRHITTEELKEILKNHRLWSSEKEKSHNDPRRADLNEVDLSGATLCGADLSHADLNGVYLSGTNLSEANLTEAKLEKANLRGADLKSACIVGADLFRADLYGADLTKANLKGANLIGADLSYANLSEANLAEADLTEAFLTGADLFDTDLRGTNIYKSNFSNATLTKVDLIGAECFKIGDWTDAKLEKLKISEHFENKLPLDLLKKYRNTITIFDDITQKDRRLYVEISNNNNPDETIVKTHINYFSQFLLDFYGIHTSIDITTQQKKIVVEAYPKDSKTSLKTILEAFIHYLLFSKGECRIIPNDNVDLSMELEDLRDEVEDYRSKVAKLRRRIKRQDRELNILENDNDELHKIVKLKNRYLTFAKKYIKEQKHILDRVTTIQTLEKNQPVERSTKITAGPGISLKTGSMKIAKWFKIEDFEFSSSLFSAEYKGKKSD